MRHALEGLAHTSHNHSNFKIHMVISSLVLLFSLALGLTPTEWIMIILVITLGLVIELVNTAIESVVDLVTEEWRQSAKLAKDASAAAMLIYAFGSSLIGLLIFIPKILQLLNI